MCLCESVPVIYSEFRNTLHFTRTLSHARGLFVLPFISALLAICPPRNQSAVSHECDEDVMMMPKTNKYRELDTRKSDDTSDETTDTRREKTTKECTNDSSCDMRSVIVLQDYQLECVFCAGVVEPISQPYRFRLTLFGRTADTSVFFMHQTTHRVLMRLCGSHTARCIGKWMHNVAANGSSRWRMLTLCYCRRVDSKDHRND